MQKKQENFLGVCSCGYRDLCLQMFDMKLKTGCWKGFGRTIMAALITVKLEYTDWGFRSSYERFCDSGSHYFISLYQRRSVAQNKPNVYKRTEDFETCAIFKISLFREILCFSISMGSWWNYKPWLRTSHVTYAFISCRAGSNAAKRLCQNMSGINLLRKVMWKPKEVASNLDVQ